MDNLQSEISTLKSLFEKDSPQKNYNDETKLSFFMHGYNITSYGIVSQLVVLKRIVIVINSYLNLLESW